jgi:hypothetical protein
MQARVAAAFDSTPSLIDANCSIANTGAQSGS